MIQYACSVALMIALSLTAIISIFAGEYLDSIAAGVGASALLYETLKEIPK